MSFLGGINLQGAAEQALRNDLELRRKRVIEAGRFSAGYYYRGGADLLLREGKFYPGQVTPEAYLHLRGEQTYCFKNSVDASLSMPELRYCEGYYATGFGSPVNHAWCVAPDGSVVEVTMPTQPDELEKYSNLVGMPFVSPARWSYWGVMFRAELAIAHDAIGGMPMLDRAPHELVGRQLDPRLAHIDLTEPHDFPVLKVKYDPNRTELP